MPMEQETFDKIYFKHIPVFCHGTILQTQITCCKKIPCLQLAGGLFLKMLKYFENYAKHF